MNKSSFILSWRNIFSILKSVQLSHFPNQWFYPYENILILICSFFYILIAVTNPVICLILWHKMMILFTWCWGHESHQICKSSLFIWRIDWSEMPSHCNTICFSCIKCPVLIRVSLTNHRPSSVTQVVSGSLSPVPDCQDINMHLLQYQNAIQHRSLHVAEGLDCLAVGWLVRRGPFVYRLGDDYSHFRI